MWYAPSDSDQVCQMTLLAVPGEKKDVKVSLVSLVYSVGKAVEAKRQSHFNKTYVYEKKPLRRSKIADEIAPVMKRTWLDLSKLPI